MKVFYFQNFTAPIHSGFSPGSLYVLVLILLFDPAVHAIPGKTAPKE
jgi:hypothetical protein